MSDEDLRDLERTWRATGSWDDWERWARRTRGGDVARFLRAITHADRLDRRRHRVVSAQSYVASGRDPRRGSLLLARVDAERDRLYRIAGRLEPHVPHPPFHPTGGDWRAGVVRAAESTRRTRADARHPQPTVSIRGGRLSDDQRAAIDEWLRERRGMIRRHGVLVIDVTDAARLTPEDLVRHLDASAAPSASYVAKCEVPDCLALVSVPENVANGPPVRCPVHSGGAEVRRLPEAERSTEDRNGDDRERWRCPVNHFCGAFLLPSLRGHYRSHHGLERCSLRGCPNPVWTIPPTDTSETGDGRVPVCARCLSLGHGP